MTSRFGSSYQPHERNHDTMGTNPFLNDSAEEVDEERDVIYNDDPSNDVVDEEYVEAEEEGITYNDEPSEDVEPEEIPSIEPVEARSDAEKAASSRPRRYNSPEANAILDELKLAGQKSADQLGRTLGKDVEEIYSLLELLRRRGQVVVDQKFARKDRRTYSLTSGHDAAPDDE